MIKENKIQKNEVTKMENTVKINLENIIKETDKAINLEVRVEHMDLGNRFSWRVWIPKSQIKNGEISNWLFVEKCKEINENIKGNIEVDFNFKKAPKVEKVVSEKTKKARATREANLKLAAERDEKIREIRKTFLNDIHGRKEAAKATAEKFGTELILAAFFGQNQKIEKAKNFLLEVGIR